MSKINIIAFSGSLRKKSFNTGLIRAAENLAPDTMEIELVDIGWLPLYNTDMEESFPADVTELKNKIKAADGVLLATPEYNRATSGVLKNMLDWTSRPYGDSAWDHKPVATMGASTGQISTALAQYDLKQSLLYLNTLILGQPEFFLGNAKDKFDENSNLTDEKTKERIVKLLSVFQTFIQKISV